MGLLFWAGLLAASAASAQQYALVPVSGNTSIGGTLDPYATNGLASSSGGNWLTGFRNPGLPVLGTSSFFPAPTPMSDRLWLRAEALYWATEAMNTPALVTTSRDGTAREQAGVLGLPTTQTLFGGDLNDSATPGARIEAGLFLTPAGAFGIQGEVFGLAEQDDGFSGGSDRLILARPFFDSSRDLETAQLIDFPDIVDGTLSVDSRSDLRSLMLVGRAALCPTCGGNCVNCQNTDRVDWLIGFRHLRLRDDLTFREDLTSLVPNVDGQIRLDESFSTRNEFNGLQLGVIYKANLNRVWLESLLRVAVGNNNQRIAINGSTTLTELDDTETLPGGLLAQTSNIGTFERDQFTMVPEIGVTLGVRIFKHLHGTVGYSLLYFPSVVRAGDAIDTDINSNLIPPPLNLPGEPLMGSARPRQQFIESDYWAQGLSLGAQLQF